MKHIVKGDGPSELRKWFNEQPIENGRRINCSYRSLPSSIKHVIKARLLEEQGGICCYTGIQVSDGESHIEHFKPQSRCAEYEDVDYRNLLAAYPGDNQHRCAFGAHAKGDWFDAEKLISPLRQDCETRFRYRQNGHVEPADSHDEKAVATIRHLKLDDPQLVELRKQVVRTVLYRGGEPLSDRQLKLIAERYCGRDRSGRFPQFCFVVGQAANELLHMRKRSRERDKAIRRQEKS